MWSEPYGGEPVGDQDGFPFTRPVAAREDEEAFSRKLRHMGKASRQKFALVLLSAARLATGRMDLWGLWMARRWVRRSKGAPGLLGASDSAYSGVGLLSEEEEDAPAAAAAIATATATASIGYDQPGDEAYGVLYQHLIVWTYPAVGKEVGFTDQWTERPKGRTIVQPVTFVENLFLWFILSYILYFAEIYSIFQLGVWSIKSI